MFGDREKYLEGNPYFTEENCPFCKGGQDEEKYIIAETKYWYIRYNKYPYYSDKLHLMSMPKKHRVYTADLSDEELKDYKNVEKFMKDWYKNEKSYFSFIRQTESGRSIEHLHYHYLPGSIIFSNESGENTLKIKQ